MDRICSGLSVFACRFVFLPDRQKKPSTICTVFCVYSVQYVPLSHDASGPEDMYSPDHILPADGALTHALAAFAAGNHVATLQ